MIASATRRASTSYALSAMSRFNSFTLFPFSFGFICPRFAVAAASTSRSSRFVTQIDRSTVERDPNRVHSTLVRWSLRGKRDA